MARVYAYFARGLVTPAGPRFGRRMVGLGLLLLAMLSIAAAGGDRDESSPPPPLDDGGVIPAAPGEGYLVDVPLPITGTVDTQLETMIDRLLDRLPNSRPRPVLILQFDSKPGHTGQGSQFERSLALARYLTSSKLSRVRTVAYIAGSVKGHAVLVAMACEQIVMHKDAELGAAGIDESFIEETFRHDYAEIANRRRIIPVPFALGMLDKDLAVYKVELPGGVRYVFADELRRLQAEGKAGDATTVTHAGELPLFTGTQLRHEYRFVTHLVENRKELAEALLIPPRALEGDPSLGGTWHAARIDVRGPIERRTVNWILQGLNQQSGDGEINLICVVIDSRGGSAADSLRLAHELAQFNPTDVRTVAFIPQEARGDAALVALACDHIVMADDAVLGGPGDAGRRGDSARPGDVGRPDDAEADVTTSIKALAAAKHRDWSLFAALVDPSVVVHRYTRTGTGEVRYLCPEEHASLEDRDQWLRGGEVATAEGLDGRRAEELELVRYLANDFDEVKHIYHLDDDPRPLEPPLAHRWIGRLAEKLASPWIAGWLLFAAMFFLSAEFSHPGIGVPGFISGVCFLLFFWSQFLHGNAEWFEILLFLAGAGCLALEVFVIPGVGIFGIGGVTMMVVSIVLASQTFVIPRTSVELNQLAVSLSMVMCGGAGVVAALFVVRRVLPSTPYLNRLILKPPEDEQLDSLRERESLVHWDHLRGKRGVTATQLTPSGKARFGDDVIDVISDGQMLPVGTHVYVSEVSGNRVVVQPIDENA